MLNFARKPGLKLLKLNVFTGKTEQLTPLEGLLAQPNAEQDFLGDHNVTSSCNELKMQNANSGSYAYIWGYAMVTLPNQCCCCGSNFSITR